LTALPRPAKLSDAEIAERLSRLPGWDLREGSLHREFAFPGFSEAWGFMSRVALAAERLEHHPDWCNSWNKVIVSLSTHDAGGITQLDFQLATAISAAAGDAA
jgi:4a-hydroxytetrahydrobiopterin dehydratase